MVQHARREAASNGTHETSLAKCILFGDSCLADARRARTQFRARAFLEADRCAARTAAKATCKTKPGLSHAIRSRSAAFKTPSWPNLGMPFPTSITAKRKRKKV